MSAESTGGSALHYDGQAIREARESRGWTQTDLASQAGCSRRTVERMESNGRVSPAKLKNLARALELPPASLTRSSQEEFEFASQSNAATVVKSRLPHTGDLLLGRDNELYELNRAWQSPDTVNVLSIIAWGGAGKTSLVKRWIRTLARDAFHGARYFDWSFYSQGSQPDRGVTTDHFIEEALKFFGDSKMADSPADPLHKAERLAELVAKQRTLLVLDGIEPLQRPAGLLGGKVSDPALSALLRRLAEHNPGLCVVTSRERVADLIDFEETTAPTWELQALSNDAGVELLQHLGVKGAPEELQELVKEVQGHALTINLVGVFLAKAYFGDVRKRDVVKLNKADATVQGGHAFKAMSAYADWLLSGGDEGARQIAILLLLGLFTRPMESSCLEVLCKGCMTSE